MSCLYPWRVITYLVPLNTRLILVQFIQLQHLRLAGRLVPLLFELVLRTQRAQLLVVLLLVEMCQIVRREHVGGLVALFVY